VKFTRIKIENFCQHKSVELTFDDEKGLFVVIKGKMGAGKTNLLNAFTWCIYGEFGEKKATNPEILNQSTLLEISVGDYVDVSVTIDVDLGEEGRATIKRTQTFKKVDERLVNPFDNAKLTVSSIKSLDKGDVFEQNPAQWIERFLPNRFKPYFLFDGERLERFFKETDAPLIKAAIQEIARIDVLDRLAANAGVAADDALRNVGKLSGSNGSVLAEEFGRVLEQIKQKQTKKSEAEETIRQSEELENDLDRQLGSISELERNIADKQKLERDIQSLERDLAGYESQFLAQTKEIGPIAFLSEALLALKHHTDEARKNKVLPPPFDLQVLQDLLDQGSCICGTDLTSGDGHSKHIASLIERYEEVSEIGELLNQHVSEHSAYLAKIPTGFALLENLNSSITRNEQSLADLKDELKSLEKALTGHDDGAIKDLASRRREVRSNRDASSNDARILGGEIDALSIESQRLKRDIEKAAATSEKAKTAQVLSDFATLVAEAARGLYQDMNTQVRTAVASSLDGQFKEMTWKKDAIKEVSIDQNYKVSVVNNRDFEILDRLSAGERLCLAFAFSLTLSDVAGLNFPMVVDTPMGRLSPEVQVHLSRVLARVTAPRNGSLGHQMILLMTETEYNDDVAAALGERDPKIYEIIFDTELAETIVEESK
jgi:DNA sulfur modification protein DndD